MDGPLKNLLVVDLTRVLVGPYCTMILSDLGARVIKIEAPEIGDDSRKFGPFIDDYSAYFMSLNRGKESIALNLKNALIFSSIKENCSGGCFAAEPQFEIEMDEDIFIQLKRIFIEM